MISYHTQRYNHNQKDQKSSLTEVIAPLWYRPLQQKTTLGTPLYRKYPIGNTPPDPHRKTELILHPFWKTIWYLLDVRVFLTLLKAHFHIIGIVLLGKWSRQEKFNKFSIPLTTKSTWHTHFFEWVGNFMAMPDVKWRRARMRAEPLVTTALLRLGCKTIPIKQNGIHSWLTR